MAKRYAGYTVKFYKLAKREFEAKALAGQLTTQHGGRVEIVPKALDRCPGDPQTGLGGPDHAHMRYDGEKICPTCGGEL